MLRQVRSGVQSKAGGGHGVAITNFPLNYFVDLVVDGDCALQGLWSCWLRGGIHVVWYPSTPSLITRILGTGHHSSAALFVTGISTGSFHPTACPELVTSTAFFISRFKHHPAGVNFRTAQNTLASTSLKGAERLPRDRALLKGVARDTLH